jgi:3-phenylpropionate/trans-cinnamate dioxygenase ferredoxin reductase subunit
MTERYVIVGASLAGLHAAEGLRREGFDGEVVLIGDERHLPYDRPPLSKAALAGDIPAFSTRLPQMRDTNLTWRLGEAAVGIYPERHVITLASGETVEYDKVLISTGTRARRWPGPAIPGMFTVRDADDVNPLRQRLDATDGRVVVIGGGFIGGEIAGVCHKMGRDVTVLEAAPVPLQRAVGPEVGRAVMELHRHRGIDFRTSAAVQDALTAPDGSFAGVRLAGGEEIAGEVCVVAMGAIRNTEWLDRSGLMVDFRGLHADEYCRALSEDGTVQPDVFVAGDVACWRSLLFDGDMLAVEHWSNAVEQGATAAANMVGARTARVHDYLPTFWSNQAGRTIKSMGVPSLADESAVVQGSVADGTFLVVYGRRGRTIGVVGLDHGRFFDHWEQVLRSRGPFPQAQPVAQPVVQPAEHAA